MRIKWYVIHCTGQYAFSPRYIPQYWCMYKIKDQIKAHDERLCPYYPSFKNHYVKKLNKIQADHPQLISRVHGTQYSVIFDNLQHLSEMLSEVLQSAKRSGSSQRRCLCSDSNKTNKRSICECFGRHVGGKWWELVNMLLWDTAVMCWGQWYLRGPALDVEANKIQSFRLVQSERLSVNSGGEGSGY